MTEAVTITPQAGFDDNDDPLPASAPITLQARVAPGNMTVQFGADGNLDQVDFTVYLPLKVQRFGRWVATSGLLTDNFTITIRGQACTGRAQVWDENGRGGIVVLATADTGTTS